MRTTNNAHKLCQLCRIRPATHEVIRAGKRHHRCDYCKQQAALAEKRRKAK